MTDPSSLLSPLLRANPDITLAYIAKDTTTPRLHLHTASPDLLLPLTVPAELANLKLVRHHGPVFRDLLVIDDRSAPSNVYQKCQNEPIQLGTQIQPAGAQWLGTAGAPLSWRDSSGARHWGLLSNYHVLVTAQPDPDHAIHQPNNDAPKIARLSKFSRPSPSLDNTIDAAIADALIFGKHTIAWSILDLPPIDHTPRPAAPMGPVTKVGRTTGRTIARCRAIGAAVRVSYGHYTALFVNQDVYDNTVEPFSAPGDSGSLILTTPCNCPTSLLFAGGGDLSVGNPIRLVLDNFNATFNPD